MPEIICLTHTVGEPVWLMVGAIVLFRAASHGSVLTMAGVAGEVQVTETPDQIMSLLTTPVAGARERR